MNVNTAGELLECAYRKQNLNVFLIRGNSSVKDVFIIIIIFVPFPLPCYLLYYSISF